MSEGLPENSPQVRHSCHWTQTPPTEGDKKLCANQTCMWESLLGPCHSPQILCLRPCTVLSEDMSPKEKVSMSFPETETIHGHVRHERHVACDCCSYAMVLDYPRDSLRPCI